jgi:hypothetical protein
MEASKSRFKPLIQPAVITILAAILGIFSAGCVMREVTSPPRSATEQLLLSTAADRAMASANLSMFNGRNVYVDFTYFDGYDSKYAEGEIRDALSRAGAVLAEDHKSADIIVEARSGAYSIDTNATFFGIPGIPLPVPSTAEIPMLPAVPFYQKAEQLSYAKIALLAYANKSRAHVYSSGPLDGKAYNIYRAILFISWSRSDVPEKNKPKYQEKYQVWHQQYDPGNLPPISSRPNH